MQKIILWGSGLVGAKAYEELSGLYDIKAYGDNDIYKQGLFYKGIPLIGKKELVKEYSDCKVVVCLGDYYEEACDLNAQGISVLGYYDVVRRKILPWRCLTWKDIEQRERVYLYAGDICADFDKYLDAICLSLTNSNYCSMKHNIEEKYPIASECVDCYQIEDVLEHINKDKVIPVLNEIYRVLKQGGYLRLSLPDYHSPLVLHNSFVDRNGEPVYDPEGGGKYIEGQVCNRGHVWFTTYEVVKELLKKSDFQEFEFYRYHDSYGNVFSKEIDYKKGYISRTKENLAFKKDISIVVDCYKNERLTRRC